MYSSACRRIHLERMPEKLQIKYFPNCPDFISNNRGLRRDPLFFNICMLFPYPFHSSSLPHLKTPLDRINNVEASNGMIKEPIPGKSYKIQSLNN